MANLSDTLGTFMQNMMSQSGENRVGNVLKDLQANLGNMVNSQGGASGILANVLDKAKSTLGSAAQNPAQAAGLGAVLGSLLGGGSSSVSGAVKGGAWRCSPVSPTRRSPRRGKAPRSRKRASRSSPAAPCRSG